MVKYKTMKEQFVPYNIALLMKEKGFTDNCLAFYNGGENYLELIDNDLINFRDVGGCLKAPLWQQCLNWLREKHTIIIEIETYSDMWPDTLVHGFRIFEPKTWKERDICVQHGFTNYYKCLDAAVQEALKLI